MTIEGFERAKELEKRIKRAKENKHDLENIITRIEALDGKIEGIQIKIYESWCYTPEGSVDISDFTDFLKKEVDCLENIITVYEQEFAEL